MAAMGWPSTFAVEGLLMSTHEGTHVDVPYHCDPSGPTVSDLPVSAFTGPGTCLDLTRVPSSELIEVAALEEATAAPGCDVRAGDHVLLHTGHHERSYGTREWFRHTGLSEAASRWLAARGVAGVGIDAPSLDSSREAKRGVYPAHQVSPWWRTSWTCERSRVGASATRGSRCGSTAAAERRSGL
jgi:kynurenine formamidase